jgi:serine/threonine protein kinase
MDYLCKEQIVHRDLRTEKILVGHGNQLKIAGLELAKRVQNDGYVSLDRMLNIFIFVRSDGDQSKNRKI